MRISDWSSDVCSSDLPTPTAATNAQSASVSLPPPSRGRAWCLPSNLPQRLPPRPEIAEQIGRHFLHLDFLRALGDAIAAVVALDVLERLVARIADAAVHLHRAGGRLAATAVRPVISLRSEEHTYKLKALM